MISIPVIDTHVHLWDPRLIQYPWFAGNDLLDRPFLPADYLKASQGIKVVKAVFIQCECDPRQYMDEVNWVSGLAGKYPFIQGLVAWAPLEKGDSVRDELAALQQNKLVKGIRRIIQFEPDIEFCLKPGFVRGVQLLEEFGLSFDLCISHIQMANTIKLVKQCPHVRFVLDHIGKPDIRRQVYEPWKSEIKELSRLPNVCCKISGLVTEAKPYQWTKEDLEPYFDHVFSCFGPDRILFGGDWPVVLTAASGYAQWFSALEDLTRGCSQSELSGLFYGNAEKFYRLEPET